MDPIRRASLAKRGFTADSTHMDTETEELKQHILRHGGEAVVVLGSVLDREKILIRGIYLSGEDSRLVDARHHGQCHANSAANFKMHGYIIMTGFALSEDGVWRQHSWNLEREMGQIIETTVPRIAYFGYELSEAEAVEFAEYNSQEEPIYKSTESELPMIDLILLRRPDNSEITNLDNRIEVCFEHSLNDVDKDIVRLWVLESVDGRYFLSLSVDAEEIEGDEDAKYKTRITSEEFLEYVPATEILHIGLLDKISKLGGMAEILEIEDETDEQEYLMSISAARYAEIDELLGR